MLTAAGALILFPDSYVDFFWEGTNTELAKIYRKKRKNRENKNNTEKRRKKMKGGKENWFHTFFFHNVGTGIGSYLRLET